MKKIALVFLALLVCFCSVWIFKMKTPLNRPDDSDVSIKTPWWENSDLPTADPEWVLDPEIPTNYIPVPGENELYMVIDDDGNVKEYRRRTKQDDGSWLWATVNPDIPQEYIPVEGLENVYMIKHDDGTVEYVKYIRNEDGSFAFIPVDKNGNPIKNKEEEDTSIIPENYIRITGNIYGVYNEHGVCIGYKERKYDEATGKYYWVDAEKPEIPSNPDSGNNTQTNPTTPPHPTQPNNPTTPNVEPTTPQPTVPNPSNPNVETKPTPSGFVETETIVEKKVAGDWVITYETVITKTYDQNGNLVSTKKEGPTEVSREKLGDSGDNVPDPSKIASTINAEYARVSVGLNYMDDVANKVLTIINTERAAAGKPTLVMNKNSNAYLLAAIKASDMAIYNNSDYDSPMYGELEDLCSRYGIATKASSDLVWKSSSGKTAEEIASRLLIMHSETIINQNHSDVAIVIVSKGGYYYIDMVLLNQ